MAFVYEFVREASLHVQWDRRHSPCAAKHGDGKWHAYSCATANTLRAGYIDDKESRLREMMLKSCSTTLIGIKGKDLQDIHMGQLEMMQQAMMEANLCWPTDSEIQEAFDDTTHQLSAIAVARQNKYKTELAAQYDALAAAASGTGSAVLWSDTLPATADSDALVAHAKARLTVKATDLRHPHRLDAE